MVNSYTNTSVAVASNAAIPFVNNRYVVGCGTSHTAGSPTVTLRKTGYYLVTIKKRNEVIQYAPMANC